MEVIQIRLQKDEREGNFGGYYNYEFGLKNTRVGVDFAQDEDGDDRICYSVARTEYKKIGEFDE
jgi:hypothetical protein